MAKQAIGVGTGDALRDAFIKVNANEAEIYTLFGNGTTLGITGDATVSGGALTIANDSVEHAMLENRYTAIEVVTNTTGATAINWGNASVFKMNASLTGAIEFDFTGYKTGQVISIYNLTGSQTVTLDSDATTSETFNKVGGVDYAGGSTNLLQIECVDDSANAVFNYSVAAYVSDATPS